MIGHFKIIEINNNEFTIKYDAGSDKLDGLFTYNMNTKELLVDTFADDDICKEKETPNKIIWIMKKATFREKLSEAIKEQKVDGKSYWIICG